MTPHRRAFLAILVTLTVLASAACASRTAPPVAAPASHPRLRRPARRPLLPDSVVWFRTSVEYRATAVQAYRLASLMLDRALADRTWTAALEQAGDFG